MNIIFFLISTIIFGNKFFSPKQLLTETDTINVETITNLYKQQGFLQVEVKSSGDTLFINEGSQYKIGKIKITGNKIFKSRELRKLLTMKKGIIFKENVFLNDIESIITKYENSGYPFCKVIPANFNFAENKVNFEFQIVEGPFVKLKEIKVIGNNSTKDFVILRKSGLKKGEMFKQSTINTAKQRLENLEFIDSVKIDLLTEDTLVIEVKEKRANTAEGIVGYQQNELAGLFELRSPNLFGTGKVVHIRWNQLGKLSSYSELEYKEPWLFASKIGFTGNFLYRKEDTTYTKKQAELLLNIPINYEFVADVGACGAFLNEESIYTGILGIGFNTQTIPGVNYHIKTAFTTQYIERIMTNFDSYIPIKHRDILFNSINFYKLMKDVSIYDELKLGGAKTLRGYWEDEFSGTTIGWSNIEYRKYSGNSFVFPFYDIGYIDGIWRQGFGIGGAVESPIGMIKIMYAVTKPNEFMDGKLHLSLQAVF
ncbi:MAG: FtsQ-type POTRA domain-containing protein [bacterium]|nr:FtsQ-type POTRA domain-containing protein [bacterium]